MTGWLERKIAKRLTLLFKNLSPDRMNLRLLKGEGMLQDLEFQEETLQRLLKLPPYLLIQRATCSKLTIKVPWTRLKQDPITLQMDYVEMNLLEPHDLKFQARYQTQNSTSETEEGQSGSVFDQTLYSVQVEVKHVRFTWQTRGVDLPGYVQRPFVCFDIFDLVSRVTDSSFQPIDLRVLSQKKKEVISSFRSIIVKSCSIKLGDNGMDLTSITDGLNFVIQLTTTMNKVDRKNNINAKIDVVIPTISLHLGQKQYYLLAQFILAVDACMRRNAEAFEKFQRKEGRYSILSVYQPSAMGDDSETTSLPDMDDDRYSVSSSFHDDESEKSSKSPNLLDKEEYVFVSSVLLKFTTWKIFVGKDANKIPNMESHKCGVGLEGKELFISLTTNIRTTYLPGDSIGVIYSNQNITVSSSYFVVKNNFPRHNLGERFDNILKPASSTTEHIFHFVMGSESCNSPKTYSMSMSLDIAPVDIVVEEESIRDFYKLFVLPPRLFKRYVPEIVQHVPIILAVKFNKPTFIIPRRTIVPKSSCLSTAVIIARCSQLSINLYPSILNNSTDNSNIDFSRHLLFDGKGLICESEGKMSSNFLEPVDISWECEFLTMKPGRIPGTIATGDFRFQNIYVHVNQEQFLFLYRFIKGDAEIFPQSTSEQDKMSEIEAKAQAYDQLVVDHDKLQSLYVTSKVECVNLIAELDTLSGHAALLRSTIKKQEGEMAQLGKELEMAKSGDNTKLVSEVRSLNKSLEALRIVNNELQLKVTEKQQMYDRETRILKDKLQRVTSEMDLQQENRRIEVEELKTKLSWRENEFQKLARELESLKRENASSKGRSPSVSSSQGPLTTNDS